MTVFWVMEKPLVWDFVHQTEARIKPELCLEGGGCHIHRSQCCTGLLNHEHGSIA